MLHDTILQNYRLLGLYRLYPTLGALGRMPALVLSSLGLGVGFGSGVGARGRIGLLAVVFSADSSTGDTGDRGLTASPKSKPNPESSWTSGSCGRLGAPAVDGRFKLGLRTTFCDLEPSDLIPPKPGLIFFGFSPTGVGTIRPPGVIT